MHDKKPEMRDDKNAPIKGDINSDSKLAGHDNDKSPIKNPSSGMKGTSPDLDVPAGQTTKM